MNTSEHRNPMNTSEHRNPMNTSEHRAEEQPIWLPKVCLKVQPKTSQNPPYADFNRFFYSIFD